MEDKKNLILLGAFTEKLNEIKVHYSEQEDIEIYEVGNIAEAEQLFSFVDQSLWLIRSQKVATPFLTKHGKQVKEKNSKVMIISSEQFSDDMRKKLEKSGLSDIISPHVSMRALFHRIDQLLQTLGIQKIAFDKEPQDTKKIVAPAKIDTLEKLHVERLTATDDGKKINTNEKMRTERLTASESKLEFEVKEEKVAEIRKTDTAEKAKKINTKLVFLDEDENKKNESVLSFNFPEEEKNIKGVDLHLNIEEEVKEKPEINLNLVEDKKKKSFLELENDENKESNQSELEIESESDNKDKSQNELTIENTDEKINNTEINLEIETPVHENVKPLAFTEEKKEKEDIVLNIEEDADKNSQADNLEVENIEDSKVLGEKTELDLTDEDKETGKIEFDLEEEKEKSKSTGLNIEEEETVKEMSELILQGNEENKVKEKGNLDLIQEEEPQRTGTLIFEEEEINKDKKIKLDVSDDSEAPLTPINFEEKTYKKEKKKKSELIFEQDEKKSKKNLPLEIIDDTEKISPLKFSETEVINTQNEEQNIAKQSSSFLELEAKELEENNNDISLEEQTIIETTKGMHLMVGLLSIYDAISAEKFMESIAKTIFKEFDGLTNFLKLNHQTKKYDDLFIGDIFFKDHEKTVESQSIYNSKWTDQKNYFSEKWTTLKLPIWEDPNFEKERNVFHFPIYDGSKQLGIINVRLSKKISIIQSRIIEAFVELSRGHYFDLQDNEISKTQNEEAIKEKGLKNILKDLFR